MFLTCCPAFNTNLNFPPGRSCWSDFCGCKPQELCRECGKCGGMMLGLGCLGLMDIWVGCFSLLGDQRKMCALGIHTTRKLLGQRSEFGLFMISLYYWSWTLFCVRSGWYAGQTWSLISILPPCCFILTKQRKLEKHLIHPITHLAQTLSLPILLLFASFISSNLCFGGKIWHFCQ